MKILSAQKFKESMQITAKHNSNIFSCLVEKGEFESLQDKIIIVESIEGLNDDEDREEFRLALKPFLHLFD